MHSSPYYLHQCWAKTDPFTGRPALTVRDHCLIVGAVAERVRLMLSSGCRGLLPTGAITLTAAHDIGKITPGFLRKCPSSFFSTIAGSQDCHADHARVSQAFLASLPEMWDSRGLPLQWGLSAGGHHGTYPTSKVRRELGTRACLEGDFAWPDIMRRELLVELIEHFGPLPSEEVKTGARVHWLTGFVTFSDWIGSNTDWFPLHPEEPLRNHYTLESVRSGAAAAMELVGWHRRTVRPELSFSQLFSKSVESSFAPRPLQNTLMDLADQPGLYIVEAPMGMGKTEAALAVAYRRWTEGDESGLYFALPTQLTSNRIHDRVSGFLENIILDKTILALVHANAWLSEDRVRAFSPADTSSDAAGAREACRWFASSRKSLLAPFGTGTVDQALMSCIGAKHSALRLFALSGKVVVIDEVHSYDPYTSSLVDQLIQWLLEVRCTVVVLSATLTVERRREMIAEAGASDPFPAASGYPLITKVVGETATHHAVEDPALVATTVYLEHIDAGNPDFIEDIARAAEAGACVLVIRNTVAIAQETYRAVKSAIKNESVPVGLLHSRFPHFLRQSNEGNWMEILGKDPSRRPAGCVLVATQVVEQSVDIDGDLLVTDLAPTDLLLQRIGRLHRHVRIRPAGFENAVCRILQPAVDWHNDPKSIKEAIGASAFIYPPASLYFSQAIWSARESVVLPADIRELLESPASLMDSLPAGAKEFSNELAATTHSMIQKALRQGPFDQPNLPDEEGVQTRYNAQPSALLVLLREPPLTRGYETIITSLDGKSQTLIAGRFNYDLAKLLHENAVRIPAWLVRSASMSQPDWLGEHISGAVLAISSETTTRLHIHGGESVPRAIHYRSDMGIWHEKTTTRPLPNDDPDGLDSWF